jgi:hypothetical protein
MTFIALTMNRLQGVHADPMSNALLKLGVNRHS